MNLYYLYQHYTLYTPCFCFFFLAFFNLTHMDRICGTITEALFFIMREEGQKQRQA